MKNLKKDSMTDYYKQVRNHQTKNVGNKGKKRDRDSDEKPKSKKPRITEEKFI